MNWATQNGADRLFLISNSKLSPALHNMLERNKEIMKILDGFDS